MKLILYFFPSSSKVSDFSKVPQEKCDIEIRLIERALSITNFCKSYFPWFCLNFCINSFDFSGARVFLSFVDTSGNFHGTFEE